VAGCVIGVMGVVGGKVYAVRGGAFGGHQSDGDACQHQFGPDSRTQYKAVESQI